MHDVDIEDSGGAGVADGLEFVADGLAVDAVGGAFGRDDADGGEELDGGGVVNERVGAVAVVIAAVLRALVSAFGVDICGAM